MCLQKQQSALMAAERHPQLSLGSKTNKLFSRLVTQHDVYTEVVLSRKTMNDEEK